MQLINQWRTQPLPLGKTLIRRQTIKIALDGKDLVDPAHRLERNRGDGAPFAFLLSHPFDIGELEQWSSSVSPAKGRLDRLAATLGVEHAVVAGTGLHLRDSGVVGEMVPWMLAPAIG